MGATAIAEPEDLQKIRERVQQLAKQIEELAGNSSLPETTFFAEFLPRLITALGAPAGAVWTRGTGNRLELACELNLARTGYWENPQADQCNHPLIAEVWGTGQTTMYGVGETSGKKTPTSHLLILSPLQRGKECVGIVEVFLREDTPVAARTGYLQFVEQMCGYASRYLQLRSEEVKEVTPAESLRDFQRFAIDLQRSLDLEEVTATAANDGRQLIRCDRVSIAVHRRNRTRISAISGQDTVHRKANLVRLMEALTIRVLKTGEPLIYTGKVQDYAPQIETALANYIQESGSRFVMVVPCFPPEPLIPKHQDEKKKKKQFKRKRPIGAVIVEQVTESRPRPGMTDRIKIVSELTSAALSNTLIHQRLFLLPLWRFLGEVAETLRGRALLKVLAAIILLGGLGAGMVLIPWDYRVEGKGRLMPVVQEQVFATWSGQVVDVFVESDDIVKEGDPLVQLRNEELQQKYVAAEKTMIERDTDVAGLIAQLGEARNSSDKQERVKIEGKLSQARVELVGAKSEFNILKSQVEQLTIRAPISGRVTTFQVEQLLLNRPVERGDMLLEVMDTSQDWRLELKVAEYRLGHIIRAQQAAKNEHLPVKFVLATASEIAHEGEVQQIATRATTAEEEGSVVEVYVSLSPAVRADLASLLRVGADVNGKINCGKCSLGYVIFGDVLEFIQNRLWF